MYRLLHKKNAGNSLLRSIFVASLFFSFHFAFVTYVNSTFLKSITTLGSVGFIYAAGAFLAIITFLLMPKLMLRIGAYKIILLFAISEVVFLSVLGFSTTPWVIICAFILHHAINPLIFLSLDVGIEELTDQQSMGKIRGFFLSLISFAYMIAPFTTGLIVENFELQTVYSISLLFMTIFLLYSLRNLRNMPQGTFTKISPSSELKEFWSNKPIRNIGVVNFILQFFYVWMVIYMPIYLTQTIGFTWGEVGLILSIALIPFVVLEAPIGELADRKYGEKEFLICGFILISLSLLVIANYEGSIMAVWAMILFVSRVGASLVETSAESFFFKKAQGRDELIGIYRIGSPMAFIIGPLIGTLLLPLGIEKMFGILILLILFGLTKAASLKDTR